MSGVYLRSVICCNSTSVLQSCKLVILVASSVHCIPKHFKCNGNADCQTVLKIVNWESSVTIRNLFIHACCPFLCRYILDPRKKPHVKIQPPFIRPDLSDRQITIKVSDNGIHSTIISSKVSCSQLLQSFSMLFPFCSNIQLTYFQSFFCGGVPVFSCFIPTVSCHKCVTWCIPSSVPSFPF